MNKAFVVAKWEYLEKVKSKAFLISLFLTPLIMVGMGVLPTVFATQEDDDPKVIGIIDLSGEFAAPFAERITERYKLPDGKARYVVHPIAVGPGVNPEEARRTADAMVVSQDVEGYFMVGEDPMKDSLFEYRARAVGDLRTTSRIEDVLQEIITEKRLVSLGLEKSRLRELRRPLGVKTVKLSKTGEEEEGGFARVFFTSYVLLMMMFFLVFTSGQMLVRSVIEEKANRIVEILVSSCSSTELMAGKVLGLSGLGFTQIGFWALMAVAIAGKFNVDLVPPEHALLLLAYFVLGYLLYASVFIGMGSPLTTEQEAQQMTGYLVLVLLVPLVVAIPAIQSPDAAWVRVLTFIPLLTPTMMALRIPIQTPSTVEIIGSVLLLVVSIILGMWMAGRIFRVALLATGKRPTVREILRWVRS